MPNILHSFRLWNMYMYLEWYQSKMLFLPMTPCQPDHATFYLIPPCHAMPDFIFMLTQTSVTDEIAEEKYNDWAEGYIYSYYVLKDTIVNIFPHLIRFHNSTLTNLTQVKSKGPDQPAYQRILIRTLVIAYCRQYWRTEKVLVKLSSAIWTFSVCIRYDNHILLLVL